MPIDVFNMTLVLPRFLPAEVIADTGNNWTLNGSGQTDANKWPCCG